MDEVTYIEKIEIRGLWGKYDIEWHLNSDVNILAGINGSGKSTVLNVIVEVLGLGGFLQEAHNLTSEVKVSFNDNKVLHFFAPKFASNLELDNMLDTIQKSAQKSIATEETDLVVFTVFKEKELNNNIVLKIYASERFGDINNENVSDVIKVHKISTFEQFINVNSSHEQHHLPDKIKTNLDFQLFELQREYLSYQINLGKRVEQVFSESTVIDVKAKREEIYGKKEFFTQTINQFFAQTGKTITSDKNNEIVFRQDDNIITPYQLSSGEKQILLILLSVLIQDNQPYILIMDEPEISLHIDWQEHLIRVIRSLNENVQVILATHSPALVMTGWMDKVTEMEDITKKT